MHFIRSRKLEGPTNFSMWIQKNLAEWVVPFALIVVLLLSLDKQASTKLILCCNPVGIGVSSAINMHNNWIYDWSFIFTGPIGTYHEQGNMLRNVENGFTRLRCASQSVSGVTEATLNSPFNQRVASLNNDKLTFYLPLRKRVRTFYGLIGDSFGYICLAIGLSFLLATFVQRRKEGRVSL